MAWQKDFSYWGIQTRFISPEQGTCPQVYYSSSQ